MSYGVERETACKCGQPLIVVDYDADPPPIPRRVRPSAMSADGTRSISFCPRCDDELDAEALLAKALA